MAHTVAWMGVVQALVGYGETCGLLMPAYRSGAKCAGLTKQSHLNIE